MREGAFLSELMRIWNTEDLPDHEQFAYWREVLCEAFVTLRPETARPEHELAVMTKVFCSETCVDVVYGAIRIVGVDSYTDMHPWLS